MEEVQTHFVFVPTDKASNNIAIVCKKFYIEQSLKELGIYHDKMDKKGGTYVKVEVDAKSIINRHKKYMKSQLNTTISEKFPFLYWIPKMQKNPSKQRHIAVSRSCSTKPSSKMISFCLKAHTIIVYELF